MSTNDTQAMPTAPVPEEPPADAAARRRRWLLAGGAAAAVALAVGVFFIGQATASSGTSGPSTLGAAVSATRAGTLPCGSTNYLPARTLTRLCQGSLTGAGAGAGAGATGGSAAGAGGRALMAGTVTGVNGSQVTIQTGQGTVLTLNVGTDADVRTTTLGSISDLTTGDRVLLTGGGAAGGSSAAGGTATRQILVLRGAGAGGGAGAAAPTTPTS